MDKSYCVMPFINLATETNGKCKICCVVSTNKYIQKDDDSDFLIQKDDIKDIWNSNYVKNIRTQMLNGEWPDDCFYCKDQEVKSGTSPRLSYNNQWKKNLNVQDRFLEAKNEKGNVTQLPMSLEPRPGILCNLTCITCWSMSSSKIYSERKKEIQDVNTKAPQFLIDSWIYEVAEAEKLDKGWPDSAPYLNNIEQVMPTLKRLYFTGGEPLLIKSNILLLKKLIQSNKRDILVSFTTNLTVWNQELIDVLSSFERVEFTCSIDALGPLNSYIRHPSKWDNVVSNLKKIMQLSHSSVSLMILIQNANVVNYIELLYWLKKENLSHLNLIPTMLHSPNYLRPDVLPEYVRKLAIKKYELALADPEMPDNFKQNIEIIYQQIKAPTFENDFLLSQFKSYINYLNQSRNLDFVAVAPEFNEFFSNDRSL